MATLHQALSAPTDLERAMLKHIIQAQRELETALRLASSAKKTERKSIQRKRAYVQIHRTLLEAANRLNSVRGTYQIKDDPEWESPQRAPKKAQVAAPAPPPSLIGSDS